MAPPCHQHQRNPRRLLPGPAIGNLARCLPWKHQGPALGPGPGPATRDLMRRRQWKQQGITTGPDPGPALGPGPAIWDLARKEQWKHHSIATVIDSMDELQDLNRQLNSEAKRILLTAQMVKIGGDSLRENVNNVMKRCHPAVTT
ncbi:hypothetical protein MATL_G00209250 [Megalops atlanticus]|uniref:Uncharacterized protein n=1 Tax=Megalops atlanticus TaxID=7932 RepID=A0A9D3PFM8_MEGAT|nr:hypothetical protein MATL_G00209250 [Megalops atlanticus]